MNRVDQELTNWIRTGDAVIDTGGARTPPDCMRMPFATGGTFSEVVTNEFQFEVGRSNRVTFWVKGSQGEFDIGFWPSADGSPTSVEVLTSTKDGEYRRHTIEFTPASTPGRLWFHAREKSGQFASGDWFLDDVRAGPLTTYEIREAVALDCEDISVANGFDITVEKVFREPVHPSNRQGRFTCALVPEESFESDLERSTCRKAEVDQLVTVQIQARGKTPRADISKLMDSVRNAVERDGSHTRGVPGVRYVDATSGEIGDTSEDIKKGVLTGEVSINVRYRYTRGGL